MENTFRKYTPDEVLRILQEEHRLFSPLDCDAEADVQITRDMKLMDWRIARDFLPWEKLYLHRNEMFRMNVLWGLWEQAVMPEKRKTVWDMCILTAQHADKEVIQPVTILGTDCLSAAVFLTLKKNLLKRCVPVADVRPSTEIAPFLNEEHWAGMITEAVLTGTRTLDHLKPRLRSDLTFWQKINIFRTDRYYLDTGAIKTFGDLAERVAQELLLGKAAAG